MALLLVTKRKEGGVGDYCNILASQLKDVGIRCDVISIFDKDVVELTPRIEGRSGENYALRIPASFTWLQRSRAIIRFCIRYSPTVISLQLSKGEFGKRPLQFSCSVLFFVHAFRGPRRHYPIHIMFHELITGWELEFSKPSILNLDFPALSRFVKRFAARQLVRRLKPIRISTNSRYLALRYQNYLSEPIDIIPLFGNIIVRHEYDEGLLHELLSEWNDDIDVSNRGSYVVMGHFGSGWRRYKNQISDLHRLAKMAQATGRKLIVVHIGVAGTTLSPSWTDRELGLYITRTGYLQAEGISRLFNVLDFGITFYPLHMIDKSGAVTAMLEHGLPVITTWGENILPEYFPGGSVRRLNHDWDILNPVQPTDRRRVSRRPEVVRTYKHLIKQASSTASIPE